MKVRGNRPSDTALRRLRGVLHVVETADGRVVARSWPRKRGPNGTPAQLAARADFQNVLQWVKEPMTMDVEAAQSFTQNTLYLPRDIMEAACYGTIMQATTRDGKRYYGVRLMAVDIQALLDTISSDAGVHLVRNGSEWIALPTGDLNQVLAAQGAGTVPHWIDVGTIPGIVPAFTPSVLHTNSASVTNPANTSEDVLQTYTMPAGTLANNGDAVRITAAGSFADSTHNRTLRLYFGSVVIATFTLAVHNENTWQTSPSFIVNRLGVTSQIATGQLFTTGSGGTLSSGFIHAALSQNLAADLVIKITAQSAAFGADTTCDQFIVEKLPHV